MRDCYEVLGVSQNATLKEIKSAFRKLAREIHPDTIERAEEKKRAEEKFKEVNECYQTLSNSRTRANHDAQPRPQVSQAQVDFGILYQGEAIAKTFTIENLGGTCSDIDLIHSEKDSWFQITELVQFSETEIFPCEVKIAATTENLTPKQEYKGWVEIALCGVTTRVNLNVRVEPPYFVFKAGEKAFCPEDLVPLCDLYWEEAKTYLYSKHGFREWLSKLDRPDVLSLLETCRAEKNKDIGLEKFLRSLNPSLESPKVNINYDGNDFGSYEPSSLNGPVAKVQIQNFGRGCCYGTLEFGDTTWLYADRSEFALAPGKNLEITVRVDSSQLQWENKYQGQLIINNNSHDFSTVTIDFSLATPRHPERVRIESMLDEGKWQTAGEALNSLRGQGDWVKTLEQRAGSIKSTYIIAIIVGTSLLYGVPGFMAVEISEFAPFAAIAGPIGAIIYTAKRGGRDGYATDFVLGGLTGLGIFVVVTVAIYIIIIILFLLVLALWLGGG